MLTHDDIIYLSDAGRGNRILVIIKKDSTAHPMCHTMLDRATCIRHLLLPDEHYILSRGPAFVLYVLYSHEAASCGPIRCRQSDDTYTSTSTQTTVSSDLLSLFHRKSCIECE